MTIPSGAQTRQHQSPARVQEVLQLDDSSSSSEDEEITVTDVKVPFQLRNPTTLEATIMQVGPLPFELELSPTFNIQEGLSLQVVLFKFSRQEIES